MKTTTIVLRRLRRQIPSEDRAARSNLSIDAPIDDESKVFERPGAVLFRSPKFGELWLAQDPCIILEISAEESSRPRPRPILLVEDWLTLDGKPEAIIRLVLETARVFPGLLGLR